MRRIMHIDAKNIVVGLVNDQLYLCSTPQIET
jgi:hypothetical protein